MCAVVAMVLAQATAGRPWAVGMSVGLAVLALWMVLSAFLFLGAVGLGILSRRRAVESPFAGEAPPPQVLRPIDPEG
jgi:hypothetical protein